MDMGGLEQDEQQQQEEEDNSSQLDPDGGGHGTSVGAGQGSSPTGSVPRSASGKFAKRKAKPGDTSTAASHRSKRAKK